MSGQSADSQRLTRSTKDLEGPVRAYYLITSLLKAPFAWRSGVSVTRFSYSLKLSPGTRTATRGPAAPAPAAGLGPRLQCTVVLDN